MLKIKTGYIQTDEGGVNTQYKSNKKQKMGTYAVNIYGWIMCKLTVPQRTISRKGDNQVIVVCQYKVDNYCELVNLNLLSGFSIDL